MVSRPRKAYKIGAGGTYTVSIGKGGMGPAEETSEGDLHRRLRVHGKSPMNSDTDLLWRSLGIDPAKCIPPHQHILHEANAVVFRDEAA